MWCTSRREIVLGLSSGFSVSGAERRDRLEREHGRLDDRCGAADEVVTGPVRFQTRASGGYPRRMFVAGFAEGRSPGRGDLAVGVRDDGVRFGSSDVDDP
jgi:hypothetical protein